MNKEKLKHHLLTILSVIVFSLVTALTINQCVKNSLVYYPSEKSTRKLLVHRQSGSGSVDIDQIVESGFFPDYSDSTTTDSSGSSEPDAALADLTLLGTITGDPSVTMALIMKKGDTQPKIYKRWSGIGGFTITGIYANYVQLKRDKESFRLELYDKKQSSGGKPGDTAVSSGVVKKNVSRAEIQQRVMNNLDKAMEGIKGGPYKVNNQIEGFRIIRIQSSNILYEYGIRNGDIIKRVNGKKIDSTEKLLTMWHGFKNESRLVFDVERRGQIITFDMNITD